VTQRGNRREQTFFDEGDYELYRALIGEAAEKAGAEIWCYCLMPNHVHLIIVPSDEDGLRLTFADAHRRYTGFINARHRWTGHLWQGRFGAVVMDEVRQRVKAVTQSSTMPKGGNRATKAQPRARPMRPRIV
jgi:putative transposase